MQCAVAVADCVPLEPCTVDSIPATAAYLVWRVCAQGMRYIVEDE